MIPCFEIFSITPVFDIDITRLEAEYFKAQRQYHPDRFVGKPAGERNQALQKSMDINHAYETLKNPLTRAQHLLQLQGIIVGTDADTIKPSNALLMEVIELREQLEEGKKLEQISELHKNSLLDISKYYANKEWQKIAQETLRLGYIVKMVEDKKTNKL
jgi:molecular chaperone HscB